MKKIVMALMLLSLSGCSTTLVAALVGGVAGVAVGSAVNQPTETYPEYPAQK